MFVYVGKFYYSFNYFSPFFLFYPQSESGLKRNGKQVVDTRITWNDLDGQGLTQDPTVNETRESDRGSFHNTPQDSDEEMDDIDWEDGSTAILESVNNHPGDGIRKVTIEFSDSPDSAKRKSVRRATAEEKVK